MLRSASSAPATAVGFRAGAVRVRIEEMEPSRLAPLWRDLEARAAGSFFQSWDWVGTMLAAAGARTARVVVAEAGGQAVALGAVGSAPRRRHGVVHSRTLFLNESGDPALDRIFAEYNGLIVAEGVPPGVEEACFAALLDAVGRGVLPEWDELRLGGVSSRYVAAVERVGLSARIVDRKPSFAVDLAAARGGLDAYLGTLNVNARQQIRRSLRLYAGRGRIELRAAATTPEALAWFEALRDLNQATWRARGKTGAFAGAVFERFHRQLIAECLPRGRVELLRVSAGGRDIGYLYDLIHGGWVGNYASGLVYEADARLKPGLACLVLAIERHAARGARRFDFMAGGARYKMSLGEPGPELFWIDAQRPRLRFRLEALAAAARVWMLNSLPAGARP